MYCIAYLLFSLSIISTPNKKRLSPGSQDVILNESRFSSIEYPLLIIDANCSSELFDLNSSEAKCRIREWQRPGAWWFSVRVCAAITQSLKGDVSVTVAIYNYQVKENQINLYNYGALNKYKESRRTRLNGRIYKT